MTDAHPIETDRIERIRGYSRTDRAAPSTAAATQTLGSDKLEILRNVQGDAEMDTLALRGALRALAVLIGSSNNARDVDPSDFEFLINMLIERADIVVDHISSFRSVLNGG